MEKWLPNHKWIHKQLQNSAEDWMLSKTVIDCSQRNLPSLSILFLMLVLTFSGFSQVHFRGRNPAFFLFSKEINLPPKSLGTLEDMHSPMTFKVIVSDAMKTNLGYPRISCLILVSSLVCYPYIYTGQNNFCRIVVLKVLVRQPCEFFTSWDPLFNFGIIGSFKEHPSPISYKIFAKNSACGCWGSFWVYPLFQPRLLKRKRSKETVITFSSRNDDQLSLFWLLEVIHHSSSVNQMRPFVFQSFFHLFNTTSFESL